MADIELVIKIPEEHYNDMKNTSCWWSGLKECVLNGTPLPKGHGRLIDADDIDNHIVGSVDTRDCPTIIEADKAESEDKE